MTVVYTHGMVAASSNPRSSGMGAQSSEDVTILEAKDPGLMKKTRCPGMSGESGPTLLTTPEPSKPSPSFRASSIP
jgi:hypothetical protein